MRDCAWLRDSPEVERGGVQHPDTGIRSVPLAHPESPVTFFHQPKIWDVYRNCIRLCGYITPIMQHQVQNEMETGASRDGSD